MDALDTSITLVVKAPNQQIDDQIINCDNTWSVKQLKDHLSEVYPNKPQTGEQKLIYAGQLLPDNLTLKDVLRHFDGQTTHTFHLVCAQRPGALPRTSSNESTSTTSTTLSARSSQESVNNPTTPLSSSSSTASSSSSSPSEPESLRLRFPTPAAAPPPPPPPPLAPETVAQQMAYMQQVYAQYMNHYMQCLQAGVVPQGFNFQPPTGYYQPMVWPQANQPVNQNAAQGPNAQPRQQDNNANAQGAADEEGGGAHQDWLDFFYFLSRVLVLISIVYFYSSLTRFLLVCGLAFLFYVYHIGIFRRPLVVENGENQNNNNNNNNNNRAERGRPQNNDAEDEPVAEHPADAPPPAVPPPAADAEREAENRQPEVVPQPNFAQLVWNFVIGFVTSLIPDQPQQV